MELACKLTSSVGLSSFCLESEMKVFNLFLMSSLSMLIKKQSPQMLQWHHECPWILILFLILSLLFLSFTVHLFS